MEISQVHSTNAKLLKNLEESRVQKVSVASISYKQETSLLLDTE